MHEELDDNIIVQEPAISELKKHKSCVGRSCLQGCGCFVFLFILILIFLKINLSPQTKQLKDLPKKFTENFTLYDEDNIEKITYTAGKTKHRLVEYSAYVPKLIISPIAIYLDNKNNKQIDWWLEFKKFMFKPITDKRDTVKIEWHLIPSDVGFLLDYYQKELKKHNFKILAQSSNENTYQFSFQKNEIDGNLVIYDSLSTPEVDYLTLTININLDN